MDHIRPESVALITTALFFSVSFIGVTEQVELARNALALQGLAGDMLLSKRRQASRKRARPQQTNHVDDSDNIKSFTSPEPSSNAESGSPPSSGGFERLFGDSGVVALEAALGQGYMGGENKDAAESLFENTVKAFCCMAGGGAGEDRPPMQVCSAGTLRKEFGACKHKNKKMRVVYCV